MIRSIGKTLGTKEVTSLSLLSPLKLDSVISNTLDQTSSKVLDAKAAALNAA